MAFKLYILYIVSIFIHIPNRLPFLAAIRFDMMLVGIIVVAMIFSKDKSIQFWIDDISRWVLLLFIYIVVTLPFVQWPGTVLRYGIQEWFKGVVFLIFTVCLVTDIRRLRFFLLVFAGCQVFRVIEPVFLHVTTGYWGDTAFMGAGEMMDRLAGAPHDPINPNGLAYVVITAAALCYYLIPSCQRVVRFLYIPIMTLSGYALILTGSRSGFVTALVILAVIVLRSRKKVLVFAVICIFSLLAIANLNDMQRDRYLSIYRDDVRGSATSQGRIDGLWVSFDLALNKPFVGHGIGTSSELGYNFRRDGLRAHNLYLEIWQEIGLFGLTIFIFFMVYIIFGWLKMRRLVQQTGDKFLIATSDATGVWLLANLVFSLVSYGLLSYPWYLLAGLVSTIRRIAYSEIALIPSPKEQAI